MLSGEGGRTEQNMHSHLMCDLDSCCDIVDQVMQLHAFDNRRSLALYLWEKATSETLRRLVTQRGGLYP